MLQFERYIEGNKLFSKVDKILGERGEINDFAEVVGDMKMCASDGDVAGRRIVLDFRCLDKGREKS